MAPSEKRGSHEEDPVYRRADGDDPPRGRSASRSGGGQKERRSGPTVSAQTLYAWRKHFGTLEPADVKRLRQLEQENGRLKKMVADRDLEIDVLKEITRKKW